MLCVSSKNKGFHQCIARPADCQESYTCFSCAFKKHCVFNKTQQVSGYIIIAKRLHLYAINRASN